MGYTVRTRTHRYTVWKVVKTGEIRARELYDRRSDPLEMTNIVDHPDQAALVKQLAALRERGYKAALPTG